MCGDLPEVYLVESARPCLSSRSTACSTRGSSRACVRECRSAESPNPGDQTSPTVSAVPPGDNGRDQIVWRANRKKCCDIDHLDLGIVPWFPPLSAEAPERTSSPFARPLSSATKLVAENCRQDRRRPAAAVSKEPRPWLRSRTVSPESGPSAIPEAARVPRRPLRRKAKRES